MTKLVNEKEIAIVILNDLKKAIRNLPKPLITQVIELFGKDPFLILISCLLSLRARDIRTLEICKELFVIAKTPEQILNLDINFLEKILYSGALYKKKAKIIKEVSYIILTRFSCRVPSNKEDLLSIKGIGNKTAALVLAKAFDIPAICVDVHVHRISNRLGLVNTSKVNQTEEELRKIFPQNYWNDINEILVTWGQNQCLPLSPICSKCPVKPFCLQRDIKKSR